MRSINETTATIQVMNEVRSDSIVAGINTLRGGLLRLPCFYASPQGDACASRIGAAKCAGSDAGMACGKSKRHCAPKQSGHWRSMRRSRWGHSAS